MITTAPVLLRAAAVLADNPTSTPSPGGASDHFTNKADTSGSYASQLTTLVGYAAWVVTAIAIIALIWVGVHWAINTHNGQQENLKTLGRWAKGASLAGAAGQIANTIFGFNLFTPHPQAIPGLTAIQHWIDITTLIAIALAVIGIMFTGGMAALRHHNGEPLGESLIYVLGGCFIIASASGITYTVLAW